MIDAASVWKGHAVEIDKCRSTKAFATMVLNLSTFIVFLAKRLATGLAIRTVRAAYLGRRLEAPVDRVIRPQSFAVSRDCYHRVRGVISTSLHY